MPAQQFNQRRQRQLPGRFVGHQRRHVDQDRRVAEQVPGVAHARSQFGLDALHIGRPQDQGQAGDGRALDIEWGCNTAHRIRISGWVAADRRAGQSRHADVLSNRTASAVYRGRKEAESAGEKLAGAVSVKVDQGVGRRKTNTSIGKPDRANPIEAPQKPNQRHRWQRTSRCHRALSAIRSGVYAARDKRMAWGS